MTAEPVQETIAPPAPLEDAGRITVIDTLRGVACLGILILNVQWMSMIGAAATNPTVYPPFEGANWWVWVLSHVLAEQKFMTVFSILFGAGIMLMTTRIEDRGGPAKRIHFRRMFFLLLIGMFHAYFIWYGDILFSYAICGMLVYSQRKRRPKTLIVTGLIVVSVASLLTIGIGASMPYWPEESRAEVLNEWQPNADAIEEDIAGYRGNYLEIFLYQAPTALSFQTFILIVWALWRAGGLMLIGMGLYKLGVVSGERSAGFYKTLLALGLFVGIPAVVFGVNRNIAAGWAPEYSFFWGGQYNYWGSLLVSLGWIGAVMLMCASPRLAFVTTRLAAVGRMALTNYLIQSIICTAIFYGWGLGLYGEVERVGQIFVVLFVWVLQLVVSPVWLEHFRYGPAEWLWRSVTYRRRQPFRIEVPLKGTNRDH